jgi:hypothetical protein
MLSLAQHHPYSLVAKTDVVLWCVTGDAMAEALTPANDAKMSDNNLFAMKMLGTQADELRFMCLERMWQFAEVPEEFLESLAIQMQVSKYALYALHYWTPVQYSTVRNYSLAKSATYCRMNY